MISVQDICQQFVSTVEPVRRLQRASKKPGLIKVPAFTYWLLPNTNVKLILQ